MAAWGRSTPRENIEAECRRRGRETVIAGGVDLLQARDVDDALVLALGGAPADYVLSGGAGGKTGYWPRSWAARGLLHVWGEQATAAIIDATTDEAWRVREMAAKVIARHLVGAAMDAVLELREDPVPRVRAAADRAVRRLSAAGE